MVTSVSIISGRPSPLSIAVMLLSGCASVGPVPIWSPPCKSSGYRLNYEVRDLSRVTVEVTGTTGPPLRLGPGEHESAPLFMATNAAFGSGYDLRLVRTDAGVVLTCRGRGSASGFCPSLRLVERRDASPGSPFVVGVYLGQARQDMQPNVNPQGEFWVAWPQRHTFHQSQTLNRYGRLETSLAYWADLNIKITGDWRDVTRVVARRLNPYLPVDLVLYDTGQPPAAPASFAGRWTTSFGDLLLEQDHANLKGTLRERGRVETYTGRIIGDVALLSWQSGSQSGRAFLKLGPDGRELAGTRSSDASDSCTGGVWRGLRAQPSP